jgi:hypothetical protein
VVINASEAFGGHIGTFALHFDRIPVARRINEDLCPDAEK